VSLGAVQCAEDGRGGAIDPQNRLVEGRHRPS
jgi:hypothetical protein